MRMNIRSIDIPAISWNVLHTYFDNLIKLFSDLYLEQILSTLKPFFPHRNIIEVKNIYCNFCVTIFNFTITLVRFQ